MAATAQTDADREAIFIANFAVAEQSTREATELREQCRERQVACADCEQRFAARELDSSTGLCGVCYDIGGEFNEYQDGLIEWDEFVRRAVAADYRGSEITDEDRARVA